jgi:hypothetical protein
MGSCRRTANRSINRCRDAQYLKEQAQESLKSHIQDILPQEYQRCLTGFNQVLKLGWQIANNNNVKQNSHDQNDNGNTVRQVTTEQDW